MNSIATNSSDFYKDENLSNLFAKYDKLYFSSVLKNVKASWSDKMTLCTGKTYFGESGNKFCSIKLSRPILKQRPFQDAINTLLHEMIHAYLFMIKGKATLANGHGPDFQNIMKKINNLEGSNIRIRHTFRKEVNKFRVHIYKCDGPCRFKKPFYGTIRRAILRPPGPEDKWWARHSSDCGGTFHKISGPSSDGSNGTVMKVAKPSSKTISLPNRSKGLKSDTGTLQYVKANINPLYVSQIKRINIRKYIDKYIEYNKNISRDYRDKICLPKSSFRQHLDTMVNKYISRVKYAFKHNNNLTGLTRLPKGLK